jgi:cytoskeletal protein RodZ
MIPDDVGPDTAQADGKLIEFIERRREEQARNRRQRLQLIVIACLGVIGLLLTVSNAVLVSRLLARRSVPPATAPLSPVRGATLVTATVTPPEPVAEPAASPPPESVAEPAASRPREPVAEAAASPPAPSEERVERTAPQQRTAVLPRSPTPTLTVTSETDSARRTARWLVEMYGPLEAKRRALAAAQFYSGEDSLFWRRVADYALQIPAR